MHTVMKVKDDQVIMYTDGSITITKTSGYTRDIPKDSHLYAVLADAFKMRELLQAVLDKSDSYISSENGLNRTLAQIHSYFNSLPR